MKRLTQRLLLLLLAGLAYLMPCQAVTGRSVYTQKPVDKQAHYLSVKADGKTDVTNALQQAINQLKSEQGYGILFIPEGKYLLSSTVYIPASIRLIGYGKHRPEFILAPNSPGYGQAVANDKGKAKYMFWFTGGMVEQGREPQDANAGTFYSALSNVNLRIGDGNPHAVALRTHYAQHCYVSHLDIYIGNGKAGIFDIGNELEDIAFYGGDYGIYTTKSSPGWPVAMVDTRFEGQRKAALRCQESGLAIVSMVARTVPRVFDIDDNYCDKLYVEDSWFENVSDVIVNSPIADNSNNQLTMRRVACVNAKGIVRYGGQLTEGKGKSYYIRTLDYGLQMESLTNTPEYRKSMSTEPLSRIVDTKDVIPALPDMRQWVNLRELGAVGDGETDDTDALQRAIDQYDCIYVPQGLYRVTRTVRLRPSTRLIGLHPYATQLVLTDNTPGFSGFGSPVPLLESSVGGTDVLTGIGINTGTYNYRAVGVKWMAGSGSYMNDVKFVGGHGSLRQPNQNQRPQNGQQRPQGRNFGGSADAGWDNQHWSLWITNGGGGTFKDIWTASTYATSGLYAQDTSTPSRLFAISIEHHVRNEVRLNRVSNWSIYAMQTEEESRESSQCQPIEMDDCHDVTFANLYMFRVIRINTPYHSSVRMRNCSDINFLNMHNFSQIKYTNTTAVFDQTKGIDIRPWELSRLHVTGEEKSRREGAIVADDFEFAEGIASDSKGNIYFCDHRMRRIYRYSPATQRLSLIADFPWKPSALAFDTADNLLVLFRYDPMQGEQITRLPDTEGTSFSGWGNSGYAMRMYSIDPDRPEETISELPLVDMSSVKSVDKAFYASNRWRDFHDFNQVVSYVPEKCFMAPDGRTIIPQQYDLARTSSLLAAIPGRPFYTADEYDRRMVRLDVRQDGTLTNLRYFVEQAEFGSAVDGNGNLYVADGDIYVFAPDGQRTNRIATPERPSTLVFGGDGHTLFATGRQTLMRIGNY